MGFTIVEKIKALFNIRDSRKWLFLFLVLGITEYGYAQPGEYVIKGVFLEKFTRFIEWPKSAGVDDTTKPFIVGIIGKDPFKSLLNQLYTAQKIKNKRVEVRYLTNISEIGDCNLLFISRSERNRISKIIELTRQKPILTVSDADGFSGSGVIINLLLSDNKIRFEINENAARQASLYMSHLLLKEAIIVDSSRGWE